MAKELFSDRERGARSRTSEMVDERAWGGIANLIQQRVADGSFGAGYPDQCPDGIGVVGTDDRSLALAIKAEIDIEWPIRATQIPEDQMAIWDTIEFLYEVVGKPEKGYFHDYYRHDHLSFDVEEGQREFAAAINRILSRNGIAFEVSDDGRVKRVLPEGIRQQLAKAQFRTGDKTTDHLLEVARAGITSPALPDRQVAIEKLWDAFERLKTHEPGHDKKASATALLNKAATGGKFREVLDSEAVELTRIGNHFAIRHHEMDREQLSSASRIDYLFFRLFTFLHLLLRSSGKGV